MISSMVMILVTLAGASRSWASCSYNTLPVDTSISTALFPATVKSAACAPSGTRETASASATTQEIPFIAIPPNLSWYNLCAPLEFITKKFSHFLVEKTK